MTQHRTVGDLETEASQQSSCHMSDAASDLETAASQHSSCCMSDEADDASEGGLFVFSDEEQECLLQPTTHSLQPGPLLDLATLMPDKQARKTLKRRLEKQQALGFVNISVDGSRAGFPGTVSSRRLHCFRRCTCAVMCGMLDWVGIVRSSMIAFLRGYAPASSAHCPAVSLADLFLETSLLLWIVGGQG